MGSNSRWERNSPITMATGDNVPSQIAIGSRTSLNNFSDGYDYNYDGLVVNKSKNKSGHLEYVHQKWHSPTQSVWHGQQHNTSDFKEQAQTIDMKLMNPKKVLPDEDKMVEREVCTLVREKGVITYDQPVHVKVDRQRLVCANYLIEKQPPFNDLEQPIIDKRQLKKKVLPSDARDCMMGVFQKQPQKRCADDQTKEEISEGLQTISLRETDKEQVHELIESINLKQQNGPKCISFDKQKFSTYENLVEENCFKNSGSFGEVSRVIDLQTRSKLIKKKVKDKVEPNEVEIPIQFLHKPNLCAVYGLYFDCSNAYIIQEDAGASLRQLGNDLQFREQLARSDITEKIIFGIFQGLAVLEGHCIVHCDIKPENVCLKVNQDGSYTAKLIDFGSCKTQNDKMTYTGLTPEYLPPNINDFLYKAMQKKLTLSSVYPRLSSKDDVWGAGMVTLYIEKGEHPVIKFFTGHQDYPRDQDVMALRCEVMKKTAELQNPLHPYFTTGKVILDEMLQHALIIDSQMRWTSTEVVTFLKAKLSPEPQMKRQRQDVLCQPRFVQAEHKLIKRDNSLEDVDLKTSKGVYQPHMPASPNSPEEVEQNFGVAFRLKQEGQNRDTNQSKTQVQQNNFYQALIQQNRVQIAPAQQNLLHQPSVQQKLFQGSDQYSMMQHATLSQKIPQQVPFSQKQILQVPVKGMWEESMNCNNDDMEYDELVQSFCTADSQIIDKKKFICPQNLLARQSEIVMQGLGGEKLQLNGNSVIKLIHQNTAVPVGNIPDMGALFDEGFEDGRIKIKGRRRSKRE